MKGDNKHELKQKYVIWAFAIHFLTDSGWSLPWIRWKLVQNDVDQA